MSTIYKPILASEITAGKIMDAFLMDKINNNLEFNKAQAELNKAQAEAQAQAQAKKGVLQIVANQTNATPAYTGSTVRPGVNVAIMNTELVTKAANTKIKYELMMNCELQHDNVYILYRGINYANWVEIGSAYPEGSRTYGIKPVLYDADNATTMHTEIIKWLDTPNAPAGSTITYHLYYYGSGNHVMRFNHTQSNGNSNINERASSSCILTEIGE